MRDPQRIYQGSVMALSVAILVLGVLMIGVTLAAGGDPLSIGFVMGIVFVGVGVGRLYLARRIHG